MQTTPDRERDAAAQRSSPAAYRGEAALAVRRVNPTAMKAST
jgi:hypothetical protein